MAALVLVAAGAAMLAWSHAEPVYATESRTLPLPDDLLPEPGPRMIGRGMTKPPADRGAPNAGTLTVEVTGENRGTCGLVVVLFDRGSGVPLARKELAGLPLPETVTFESVRPGALRVHLTRCAECAKQSYIHAADVDLAPGGRTRVSLTGTTDEVHIRFELTDEAGRPSVAGIPVWIRRPADPHWRYRRPDSPTAHSMLVQTNAKGVASFEDLGPGEYTITMQGFQPTEKDLARMTFRLGEFDERRPIRGRVR